MLHHSGGLMNGGDVGGGLPPHSYINGSTSSVHRARRSVSPGGVPNGVHQASSLNPNPVHHLDNNNQPQTMSLRSDQAGIVGGGGGAGSNQRGVLYAELQFPVTSNYGSMKKKSSKREHRDSTNTTASTSINSGDPSPSTNMMATPMNDEQQLGAVGGAPASATSPVAGSMASMVNTTQSTMASAQSMDSVHRYVPDYVAISNRKTAV